MNISFEGKVALVRGPPWAWAWLWTQWSKKSVHFRPT